MLFSLANLRLRSYYFSFEGSHKLAANLTVFGSDDLLPELDKMDDGVLLANPSPALFSRETFDIRLLKLSLPVELEVSLADVAVDAFADDIVELRCDCELVDVERSHRLADDDDSVTDDTLRSAISCRRICSRRSM